MPSALGTRPSSRRKRSVGWPGTSGATASPVYSSSRRRPPVVSHFAASATTWRTRPPARRKVSSKGVNKRQNEMRRERFERALAGDRDVVVNQGFRMRDGAMYTYEQRKLGLSAYYDKRWVLPDGIHTEPLEYHQ